MVSGDFAAALAFTFVLALAGVSRGFATALSLAGIFSGTIVLVHGTAGFHTGLAGRASSDAEHRPGEIGVTRVVSGEAGSCAITSVGGRATRCAFMPRTGD